MGSWRKNCLAKAIGACMCAFGDDMCCESRWEPCKRMKRDLWCVFISMREFLGMVSGSQTLRSCILCEWLCVCCHLLE